MMDTAQTIAAPLNTTLAVQFAPLVTMPWLIAICAAIALLLISSLFFYRRGLLWRSLCALLFLLIFLNPSMTEERRENVKDVAVIIRDISPSQKFGQREDRAREALAALTADMARYDRQLELRTLDAPAGGSALIRETRLFDALEQTLSDVPRSRRAGVIFLTDGQIHDIPQDQERFEDFGPVHVLLTGTQNERDRQIVIDEAPSYGIVGKKITIRYRVEDINSDEDYASVIIRQDNAAPRVELVPVNSDQSLTVTIDHAGQNLVDIEAAPLTDEITQANNRAPLVINGVRDRLKVLLVSGLPHTGGRTWRNLLTADPGVDLVHFTILREPDKLDATPQNELSLIAFPFRELFEIKLYDFDLIIFDRYRLNRILPDHYFENIARYVREGGALLEASGPAFASDRHSIYDTALQDILPAAPTGSVQEKTYIPALTQTGEKHPVTQGITWPGQSWAPWLRYIKITPKSGDVLMNGPDEQPLLVLDRVGDGRVAQLASDQIWLWARGYKGGGPQAELLRRLSHWLMKEPELEENALSLSIKDNILIIKRRSLGSESVEATVKMPDGSQTDISLQPEEGTAWLTARMDIKDAGIYSVNDGTQERFIIAGALNPPELRRVITTAAPMQPLVDASHGGALWLADMPPAPRIRLTAPGRNYAGSDWIALRHNNSYNITGVKESPLLPSWAYSLILLSLVVTAWWRESRPAGRSKEKL